MDQVARSIFGHFYAPNDVLRLVEAFFAGFDLPWLCGHVYRRDRDFRVFGPDYLCPICFCKANG